MDIEFDIKPTTAFNAPMFARQYQLIFIRWYMDYPDPNNFYKERLLQPQGQRQAPGLEQQQVRRSGPQGGRRGRSRRSGRSSTAMPRRSCSIEGAYTPLYYGYAYALFKPRVGGIPKTAAGVAAAELEHLHRQVPHPLHQGSSDADSQKPAPRRILARSWRFPGWRWAKTHRPCPQRLTPGAWPGQGGEGSG